MAGGLNMEQVQAAMKACWRFIGLGDEIQPDAWLKQRSLCGLGNRFIACEFRCKVLKSHTLRHTPQRTYSPVAQR